MLISDRRFLKYSKTSMTYVSPCIFHGSSTMLQKQSEMDVSKRDFEIARLMLLRHCTTWSFRTATSSGERGDADPAWYGVAAALAVHPINDGPFVCSVPRRQQPQRL
jgi:hypothetical protein